jgi:hypothetical protein
LNQNGFQSHINYQNQKTNSSDYVIQYDFHYGIKCRFDLYYKGKLINRVSKNGQFLVSTKKLLRILNKLFNKKMIIDEVKLKADVPSFGAPIIAIKLDSTVYAITVQRSLFGVYSEKEVEDEFVRIGKQYSEGFDYICNWEKYNFTDNLGYSHSSKQITGVIIKNNSKTITKLERLPANKKTMP